MKVVEIFNSIEGEGSRAGYLATFIRLYGCNLRCSYCDSVYAFTNNDYTEMSIEEIINAVNGYNCKKVTLTGGEPLIHKDVDVLVKELLTNGYEVNIETNGSLSINELSNKLPVHLLDNLMYTVDWKSHSSGMADKMLVENLSFVRPKDVFKFVVGNKEDLEQMRYIVTTYNPVCQIFVSPIFGDIEPKEIVEYLQVHSLNDIRMQLQLHKFIWPVDMRGV